MSRTVDSDEFERLVAYYGPQKDWLPHAWASRLRQWATVVVSPVKADAMREAARRIEESLVDREWLGK